MEQIISSRRYLMKLKNMEKKILILGAKGMLGQALSEVFSDKNPILWDMVDLDITDKEDVFKKIEELSPDTIINASGYTDVDAAESNQDLAMKVNGEAVGYLAEISKKIGAILVHYSTDYVFNGTNKLGYKEADETNPISVYGRSKLLGEKLIQEKGEMYYILRASWMFGENGQKNFVQKILTKAQKESSLKVVNDHFGKPTYALDLAKKTREIIEQMKPCGIYHATNETPDGGITWYDLAKKSLELKKLKIEIVPVSADEFVQPAKRPKYSALINTKLDKMRSWEEALKDYLK